MKWCQLSRGVNVRRKPTTKRRETRAKVLFLSLEVYCIVGSSNLIKMFMHIKLLAARLTFKVYPCRFSLILLYKNFCSIFRALIPPK